MTTRKISKNLIGKGKKNIKIKKKTKKTPQKYSESHQSPNNIDSKNLIRTRLKIIKIKYQNLTFFLILLEKYQKF